MTKKLALLLIAAVAIAASGSARAADTLRYAYSIAAPVLLTEPLYHAEKTGVLDREGLKLEVTRLQGDNLAIKAVISGDQDVAWVGTTAVIQAIQKGAKLKVIYSPVTKAANVLLASEKIKSLKDLNGAAIAVASIGSLSYDVPRIILKRHNIDPASATYVAVGSTSARFQALVAHKVDATMTDMELAAEAQQRYPDLHIIATVAEEIPDLNLISVIATEKLVADKPEALAKLARAEVAGEKFEIEHPEEAADMSMGRVSVKDRAIVVEGFKTAGKLNFYGLDGGLDPEQFRKTVQIMVENGELETAVPVEKILAPEIVKRAGLKR